MVADAVDIRRGGVGEGGKREQADSHKAGARPAYAKGLGVLFRPSDNTPIGGNNAQ